jgi:hypothetical protein
MQSFVALLLCESVDRSTFCVKHVTVSYENVFCQHFYNPIILLTLLTLLNTIEIITICSNIPHFQLVIVCSY